MKFPMLGSLSSNIGMYIWYTNVGRWFPMLVFFKNTNIGSVKYQGWYHVRYQCWYSHIPMLVLQF